MLGFSITVLIYYWMHSRGGSRIFYRILEGMRAALLSEAYIYTDKRLMSTFKYTGTRHIVAVACWALVDTIEGPFPRTLAGPLTSHVEFMK